MRFANSRPAVVDSGGSADILDVGSGRVVKAFVAGKAPMDDPLWEVQSAEGWVSFDAERDAYERLQAHPDIEVFAPRYYGLFDPAELEGPGRYLKGCGLLLEKLPGEATKIAHIEPHVLLEQVERVLWTFQERLGVDNPWDGSCFVPGTRADFTLVDFATPSNKIGAITLAYQRSGRLTDEIRRLLRLPDAFC